MKFRCHHNSTTHTFLDGYFSTVQDLLDWFEVNLGFTELSFILYSMYSRLFNKGQDHSTITLSLLYFVDMSHQHATPIRNRVPVPDSWDRP